MPQLGVQLTHFPLWQTWLELHWPQLPLQPSSPHLAVPQLGVQLTQLPLLQTSPVEHLPQVPSQLSLPHLAVPHWGEQGWHWPAESQR